MIKTLTEILPISLSINNLTVHRNMPKAQQNHSIFNSDWCEEVLKTTSVGFSEDQIYPQCSCQFLPNYPHIIPAFKGKLRKNEDLITFTRQFHQDLHTCHANQTKC